MFKLNKARAKAPRGMNHYIQIGVGSGPFPATWSQEDAWEQSRAGQVGAGDPCDGSRKDLETSNARRGEREFRWIDVGTWTLQLGRAASTVPCRFPCPLFLPYTCSDRTVVGSSAILETRAWTRVALRDRFPTWIWLGSWWRAADVTARRQEAKTSCMGGNSKTGRCFRRR